MPIRSQKIAIQLEKKLSDQKLARLKIPVQLSNTAIHQITLQMIIKLKKILSQIQSRSRTKNQVRMRI